MLDVGTISRFVGINLLQAIVMIACASHICEPNVASPSNNSKGSLPISSHPKHPYSSCIIQIKTCKSDASDYEK